MSSDPIARLIDLVGNYVAAEKMSEHPEVRASVLVTVGPKWIFEVLVDSVTVVRSVAANGEQAARMAHNRFSRWIETKELSSSELVTVT